VTVLSLACCGVIVLALEKINDVALFCNLDHCTPHNLLITPTHEELLPVPDKVVKRHFVNAIQ
jgi:hypothetical protein